MIELIGQRQCTLRMRQSFAVAAVVAEHVRQTDHRERLAGTPADRFGELEGLTAPLQPLSNVGVVRACRRVQVLLTAEREHGQA